MSRLGVDERRCGRGVMYVMFPAVRQLGIREDATDDWFDHCRASSLQMQLPVAEGARGSYEGMADHETRITILELEYGLISTRINDMNDTVTNLARVVGDHDHRFDRIDARFDGLDRHLSDMDGRLDRLETVVLGRLDAVDQMLGAILDKLP